VQCWFVGRWENDERKERLYRGMEDGKKEKKGGEREEESVRRAPFVV
jgi:hypothetical protein